LPDPISVKVISEPLFEAGFFDQPARYIREPVDLPVLRLLLVLYFAVGGRDPEHLQIPCSRIYGPRFRPVVGLSGGLLESGWRV